MIGAAPANDNFTNRFALAGSSITVTGSNVGASREAGEPYIGTAGQAGGKSVWWSWTAPASGPVRVTTIGSTFTNGEWFDTIAGIYTNAVLALLSKVASDDDNGGNRTSLANFTAVSNVEYQITVDGYSGVSGNIVLNLHLSNTPPSLVFAGPTNGATFREPATVPLVAYASDYRTTSRVNGVTNVTFFAGGAPIKALKSTAPLTCYSNEWSNVAAGTYELSVASCNSAGLSVTSAPVTITVLENLAPTVAITEPLNGATFIAPVTLTISAMASDDGGRVTKVEFYSGGTVLGEATNAPYSFSWSEVAPGAYTLTAVAHDNGGLACTSAPVTITVGENIAPTVALSSPAGGGGYLAPANILIAATASDTGGTITNVDFYAGDTKVGSDINAPYNFAWSNVAPGNYSIVAVAYDNGGLSATSAPVSIIVKLNEPPIVSITAPGSGSAFAGRANIQITALASDADDPVARVEFYRNGLRIGMDTNAPYTCNWNRAAVGAYSLMAVATDSMGARATSAPVSLTVTGAVLLTHVIQISVDGLASCYLGPLLTNTPDEFPSFTRLMTEGAYTLNARCDYFNSVTVPNHASMMTGRPVLQPDAQPDTVQHGYTGDSPGSSENLQITGNLNIRYKASSFDVAHDYGYRTAFYASKAKFGFYVRSWDETRGDLDEVAEDNGRNKIDFSLITEGSTNVYMASETLVDSLEYYLLEDPWGYVFLHFSDPDYTGHSYGWGSASWNNAVQQVDQQLARIFAVIDRNPILSGDTAVVLTADHGGSGYGHGTPTNDKEYTIPLFVWGAGIPAGTDVYALFGNRSDPGTLRPDYDAHPQPLRNGDTGNIALMLLGLPSIPGSTLVPVFNKPVSLTVTNWGGTITVSWPVSADSYQLEWASALGSAEGWQAVSEPMTISENRVVYNFATTPGVTTVFFRLKK